MQSRRGWIWLALLPVVGKGQDRVWLRGKPLNNQCPVCGQMAIPSDQSKDRHPVFIEGGSLSSKDMIAAEAYMIRCLRCNAAFWGDAQ